VSLENGGSTVPRRQLGRKLRELREAAQLTVAQTITALEWSKPRLWRYETGQVPIHPNDVEAMCRLYGADPELTEALKELGRESKAKGWWHSYTELRGWLQPLVGMESAASRLRGYEIEVVPGLIQSPAYAESIIRLGPNKWLTEAEVQQRLEVRIRRQQILTRKDPKAPQLDLIMRENVLVHGLIPEVMIDQLTRLLKSSEWPNISIRVVPFRSKPHSAQLGPFVIMDYPRQTPARDPEPTTVYSEHPTGALFLDKPEEVEIYSAIWNDLENVALTENASRALIEQRLAEWKS